ncbi:hypothetical protein [Nostoc favosum]|uniref:Uncharacterized protein n=1 Tax=Nostoc favosum CHAB5714 TaxID=2780399 RepID=A0ABS8I414_9NOSO|nr:hypothetical protein [Nostoc favosum]MCC5598908.1 hypothetical protein [Nostoc favosum CHAB5714]
MKSSMFHPEKAITSGWLCVASDGLFAVDRRILQLLKLVVLDRFDSSDRW